jgi:hypothetical protein
MQRRTFLKRGILGGALLAVGGGVVLATSPSRTAYVPRTPTRVLDPPKFNVMAAIAARVVTAPGADPIAIAHKIDGALARAVPEAQRDIRDVLGLFESALAGFLLDLRSRPFTQLGPDEQDAVLGAWRDSRLMLRRGAYKALKNLCVTSFYRTEAGWPAAGYSGPPEVSSEGHAPALDAPDPPDSAPVPAAVGSQP